MSLSYPDFRGLLSGTLLVLLLAACAPPSLERETETAEEAEPQPDPVVEVAPDPTPTNEPGPDGSDTRAEPDWRVRYNDLLAYYAGRFRAPRVGQVLKLETAQGETIEGRVHRVTDDRLTLDTGTGLAELGVEHLSESSAMQVLRNAYARKQAYDQGMSELAEWEAGGTPRFMREEVENSPAPVETEIVRSSLTPAPRPTVRTVDTREDLPFVVEASGRVPHVEKYIRDNAAYPDSLRIQAWGPVETHELDGGYKVRVRYSLESAANLGTSHEDMYFFMHANGRIHQRAPAK